MPLGAKRLHCPFAHALERTQRIAHREPVLRPLDAEIGLRAIDARRQERDIEPPHVIDEDAELVRVRDIEGHRGREEILSVVRLEPSGLIGQKGVCRCVAFVEAIACELVDQVEQLVCFRRIDLVVLGAARDKGLALRVHFRLDLLAHRATQQIRAAKRVAGQDLGRLHDLLLIDEDAVGFGEDAFEQRMRIFDRDATVLAVSEQADIVHRARPVERDEGDDITEVRWTDGRQRATHPFRFQLEHPNRVAALEQGINSLVIPSESVEIRPHTFTRFDEVAGLLQDRQRLEAKEVELHQPRAFAIFHVELRDRHIGARIAIERHELRKRSVTDHHASGMSGAVPRQPFKLHREIEQPPHLRIRLVFCGQFGNAVQGALESPGVGGMVGNQLCEPVHLAIAHLEHPARILQHSARLQSPESDDLGDLVAAIFLLDVTDHFLAPGFAEVDVEVRHRNAFGVEEAFEQQAEPDRIEVGNGQGPGDDRPRPGTASRPYRDAVFLRPFDEIGNDQEIARKAHADDDIQLEFEPVPIGLVLGLWDARQPRFKTCRRIEAKLGRLAFLVSRNARQDGIALRRHDSAALRHHERIGECFGQIGKQQPHVARRLDPGIGRAFHPIIAVDIA